MRGGYGRLSKPTTTSLRSYTPIVKPKLHQLHHVVDGMEFVGKLLSCFVTERKHRETKAHALTVFRHMEQTVLKDMVHSQCEQIANGIDLYREAFLVRPSKLAVQGRTLNRAKSAVLRVGEIVAGDIVLSRGDGAGRVIGFWNLGGDSSDAIFVEAYALSHVGNDATLRTLDQPLHAF